MWIIGFLLMIPGILLLWFGEGYQASDNGFLMACIGALLVIASCP